MDDASRLEHRARLGLRILMKLHESYPEPTAIGPSHAFAPSEKPETAFEGGTFGGYDDKDVELAEHLAFRMLEEGIIEGERSGGFIYPATLPARTRRVLGTRDPNNTCLLSESVRQALNAHAAGGRISAGEFTRMARLIGFEP